MVSSKSQLNNNLTQPQPNITLVRLDTRTTVPPHHATHRQKLDVSNITAVPDPILIKL